MSDIQLYLLEVDKDKSGAQRIAAQSAAKLESKQLKLVDLITTLEPYINKKDDADVRGKCVAYLADVLGNLPPKVLSGQGRRLLCDFILGRIEGDLEGIGASARALIALEERGKWDSETAQKIMRTFVDHTNPLRQFKLQTDRYAVVQLFDLLMAKYRPPMKQLHDSDPKFMEGFISFFEGEKDPRNLMIVFSILHVPMIEWDVHAYARDLFESVFNYFPITFKPPPDDPYGITAQDLKDRVRDCIAANSDFAPYAFPALLDKLDSTSMNTKRDVLQAIQASVSSYRPKTINLYSVTLWDALKFEILNVQEEDLAEASLTALALIGKAVSSDDVFLNNYLRAIIKECSQHLEDAPTKQSQAAGRILYSIASSSPIVADKIVKGIFPTLFALHHTAESIAKRRGLLEVLNQIVRAYIELSSSIAGLNLEGLQASSGDAAKAVLQALQSAPKPEVSFRLAALTGTAQLLAIRGLLSESDARLAVDTVTAIILHERIEGHGDIRIDAVKALTEIARTAPDMVRDRAITAFMAEIPDVPVDVSAVLPILEAFAQLSSEQQIFDTVAVRLKNKLNAASYQKAPKAYQNSLLLAILYAFAHGSPRPDEEGVIRSAYFTEYVEPLIAMLGTDLELQAEYRAVETVGRICNIVLRPQGNHFQNLVCGRYEDWIQSASRSEQGIRHLTPFTLHYYAALRLEVAQTEEILALLQAHAGFALSVPEDPLAPVVLRHLSLLINKFINPNSMQATLDTANIEVESLLSSQHTPAATAVAFAVVKALLVQGRCGALTSKYLELLLRQMSSSDKSFARRFADLLAPDDILTKENHCLVSGLYRQKAFNQLVPGIVSAVRTADASIKPNYLIALSGLLRWVPYSMLEPSLTSLVPPLLQTLDLTDPADHDVKACALTVCESALMHNPDCVAEHAASLITRLLNGTTRTPGGSANKATVRAKSLLCLALVPRQLKRPLVVPYRREVVKRLMACLDDPKRGVRAEAVRCRTAWLGMDDEEDDRD